MPCSISSELVQGMRQTIFVFNPEETKRIDGLKFIQKIALNIKIWKKIPVPAQTLLSLTHTVKTAKTRQLSHQFLYLSRRPRFDQCSLSSKSFLTVQHFLRFTKEYLPESTSAGFLSFNPNSPQKN